MGLICHVDLFPIHPIRDPSGESSADPKPHTAHSEASSSVPSPPGGFASSSTHTTPPYQPPPYSYSYPPVVPPGGAPAAVHPQYAAPTGGQLPSDQIVYHHEGYPITEGSKCTEALAGTTFVQAANLDYKGNKVLMFVFSVRVFPCFLFLSHEPRVPFHHRALSSRRTDGLSYQDLAVKMEGDFILRYRCFDLFSKISGEQETPVWAECYGGGFRVYSTKEFPGLRASTDLTKVRCRLRLHPLFAPSPIVRY